jgi:superfamily II DNA or RNA helicase
VIDEFHHAAAWSYQSLMEYFQPTFLLGITATPDRMDGKDVYALYDEHKQTLHTPFLVIGRRLKPIVTFAD